MFAFVLHVGVFDHTNRPSDERVSSGHWLLGALCKSQWALSGKTSMVETCGWKLTARLNFVGCSLLSVFQFIIWNVIMSQFVSYCIAG